MPNSSESNSAVISEKAPIRSTIYAAVFLNLIPLYEPFGCSLRELSEFLCEHFRSYVNLFWGYSIMQFTVTFTVTPTMTSPTGK